MVSPSVTGDGNIIMSMGRSFALSIMGLRALSLISPSSTSASSTWNIATTSLCTRLMRMLSSDSAMRWRQVDGLVGAVVDVIVLKYLVNRLTW